MTNRTAKEWADHWREGESVDTLDELFQQAMDQALEEAAYLCEELRAILRADGDNQSASAATCCVRRIRALKKGTK